MASFEVESGNTSGTRFLSLVAPDDGNYSTLYSTKTALYTTFTTGGNAGLLNGAVMRLRKNGTSPQGTIEARLYTVNSSTLNPDVHLESSAVTWDVSSLTTSFANYWLPCNFAVQSNTQYALVLWHYNAGAFGTSEVHAVITGVGEEDADWDTNTMQSGEDSNYSEAWGTTFADAHHYIDLYAQGVGSAYAPVVSKLTTATGAVGYCSSRVYPIRLPQNPVLPAMTYQVITTNREHAHGADPGNAAARVQVDIFDETYLGTVSGGRHARDALSRQCGVINGTRVYDIYTDAERDSVAEQLEDGGRTVWRRSIDFFVHYAE